MDQIIKKQQTRKQNKMTQLMQLTTKRHNSYKNLFLFLNVIIIILLLIFQKLAE
jgi:hypothetical protein